MKKCVLAAMIFLFGLVSVYSQEGGKFIVGLRGGIQIGMHEAAEDYKAWMKLNKT